MTHFLKRLSSWKRDFVFYLDILGGLSGKCVTLRHVRHSTLIILEKRVQKAPNTYQVFKGAFDLGHGGRRLGAGRPIGTGSPLNALKTARAKDRAASVSYLRDLVGTENDPARIALELARDPTVDTRLRIDCALGLVPFVHPKLSYSEVNASHVTMHADASTVLHELQSRLDRLAPQPPVIDADTPASDNLSVDGQALFIASSMGSEDDEELVSAPCPRKALK